MKFYNPNIISKCIIKDTEIEIPEDILKYSIHYYVENGEVEIYYNSLENNPPLFLYQGGKWNNRFFENLIKKIIIRGVTKEYKIWVIVERI